MTGQKSFITVNLIYENKLRAYNTQQLSIQKLTNFVNQIISPLYLENCCNLDDNIDTWYANLKKTAGISVSQELNNIWDQYHKALHFLMKIKNYKKWIIEWESTIIYVQSKNVGEALNILFWMKDLFSAIRQILLKWVNSYQLFLKEKIEADILNFWNTANDLHTAAIDIA